MTSEVWPPLKTSNVDTQAISCPYVLSKAVLGTGSYSHVYECKNIYTGNHYAAKRYSKKLVYGMELLLQSEFKVLKAVLNESKNILLMIDYFETKDSFYLVTDLAAGGELFNRITDNGVLSAAETRAILATLLTTLVHLHDNGVVHRDIKAENILFKSRSSRPSLMLLADFGHAVILKDGKLAYDCGGTLSYIAPEVLLRTGHSFPVDMWAVGVLTYFMLCGYMPFDCDTEEETKELILAGDYVFEPLEYWLHVPEAAKDFIAKCFVVDPANRITASQALKHPFIAENKPAPSSSFLNLQDAVWKFHRQQQKSNTNLSALQRRFNSSSRNSSMLSLMDTSNHTLLGEQCFSPDTVSAFTTPVTSTVVSREHSQSALHNPTVLTTLSSPVGGRNGKANFVI